MSYGRKTKKNLMTDGELYFRREQNENEARHRAESEGSFFLNKCNTLMMLLVLLVLLFFAFQLSSITSSKNPVNSVNRNCECPTCLDRAAFVQTINSLPKASREAWDRFVEAIKRDEADTIKYIESIAEPLDPNSLSLKVSD